VILTGLRIHAPVESGFLFQTENVILNPSYWNYLNGRFPLKEIRVESGKFQPYSLTLSQWKKLLHIGEKGPGAPANLPGVRPEDTEKILKSISLNFRSVDVELPSGVKEGIQGERILASLQYSPEKASFRAGITTEIGGKTGKLDATGHITPARTGRIDFKIHDLPIEFLYSLLSGSEMLPVKIPSAFQAAGLIEAEGSADFQKEAASVHIEGEVRDLDLSFSSQESRIIAIRKSPADFRYTAGFLLENAASSFVRLDLEHQFLTLSSLYIDRGTPQAGKELEISGNLNFPSGGDSAFRLMGRNLVGQAAYHLKLLKQGQQIKIDTLNISFHELFMDLPEGIFFPAEEKKPAQIRIESGELKNVGSDKISIALNGKCLDSPFHLKGESLYRVVPGVDEQSPYSVFQKADLNFDLNGVSYSNLVQPSLRLFNRFWTNGTGEGADKAEDTGPVWKYRFMDPELYAMFIRQLELHASFRFTGLDSPPPKLPDSIALRLEGRSGQYQFFTEDAPPTDAFSLSLRYSINLESQLPRHEIKFALHVKNNPISIPELTGTAEAPQDINIDYAYSGDGWLAGDLINRSFSQLSFRAAHISLKGLRPVHIIRHSMRLTQETLPIEDFFLHRSTDGTKITYVTVKGRTLDFEGLGAGEFQSGQGGRFRLSYSGKDRPAGIIPMKILNNGTWIPEDE